MSKKDKDRKRSKFDPSKSYEWDPNDEIVITGKQFQIIREALTNELKKPEFIEAVRKYEALKVVEDIFSDSVDSGIIREKTNEKE